jgi:hypothetical protein
MSFLGASKKISAREKESALLEREDFDAGPSNLDCIEPGLWLGMYIFNHSSVSMPLMFVVQGRNG